MGTHIPCHAKYTPSAVLSTWGSSLLLEVLVSLPRLCQRKSWRTLDTTTFTPRPRVAQLRWVTSPRLHSTLSLQPAHICRQTSGRRKFSRRLQSSTTPNTSPPSTL